MPAVVEKGTYTTNSLYKVLLLVVVIVPFLATLLAMKLLWDRAVGWPEVIQLAVFYILPAFVLSGAFTPIETQPEGVRPIAYTFPLTYFCHGFRAALLRQATLYDVRWDLAAMAAFVLLTFGTSVLLLRRTDAR